MVSMKQIRELARRIAAEFHPDRIILFGSYAYGTPEPDSDVDLLVIMPFRGKAFWKSLEILEALNADFTIDLLARRPADTAQRYREGDPLIREAFERGKVLYEQNRQGMA